jgi:hypothetical protein
MSGIDKTNEFYWRFPRFAFLASAYQPEDLPKDVAHALDLIASYYHNDANFQRLCECKISENEDNERSDKFRQKAKALALILSDDDFYCF